MTDERVTVAWRDVWASAERRLGRPLLVAWLVLALVGSAVVAVSVIVAHF